MRTEKEIDNLEKHIPELAEIAFKKAYFDTLSHGDSVLESIDNKIYEVFPNGTKTFIKDIIPNLKWDKSKTMVLK